MYSSIASLLLMLAMPIAQAGQPAQIPPQDAGQPAAQRRLGVTYSDGTTSTQLLRARGGLWKPKFPHQGNPPQHDGLSLSAIQVDLEAGREKDVVLQELSDYLRAQSGSSQLPAKVWVERAIATYSAWLARSAMQ